MACSGCMKARRAVIGALPERIAAPLARKFLPPLAPAIELPKDPIVPVTTAQAVIDAARALVGTPTLHQGRNEFGLDCINLVDRATFNAGLDIPKLCGVEVPPGYGRLADPRLIQYIEEFGTRLEKPIPAALLVFQFVPRRPPQHLGLYTERGTFIHATLGGPKKVVEVTYGAKWPQRTHSIWRMPGVVYDDVS